MKLIHIAVGEVYQNLDKEKNPQGFGEFGEVIHHFDNEKNFLKFFERGGFAEPDESAGGSG